jgi:hypothetical protein
MTTEMKTENKVTWHGGIGDWQMRQQTNNGRFDTILTQHWNEVGDEQNP